MTRRETRPRKRKAQNNHDHDHHHRTTGRLRGVREQRRDRDFRLTGGHQGGGWISLGRRLLRLLLRAAVPRTAQPVLDSGRLAALDDPRPRVGLVAATVAATVARLGVDRVGAVRLAPRFACTWQPARKARTLGAHRRRGSGRASRGETAAAARRAIAIRRGVRRIWTKGAQFVARNFEVSTRGDPHSYGPIIRAPPLPFNKILTRRPHPNPHRAPTAHPPTHRNRRPSWIAAPRAR